MINYYKFVKNIILLVAISVWSKAVLSAAGGGGTTAAEFLKMLPGARPVSMGGAYTAIADDKLALYYNPAGLSQLKSLNEIGATYNKWIMDTSISNLIYAHSFQEYGTVAAGISYYDSGSIEGVGETRDAVTGNFKNSGMVVSLGYGNEFFEGLSVGLAVKLISESIASESTSGFAADIGIHYKTIFDFGQTSFGAALRNIGSKLWESYSLPMTAAFGIATMPVKDLLTVAVDYTVPLSGGGKALGGLGFELTPLNVVAFRLGYKIGSDEASGLSAITFGFGYKYVQESEEDGSLSEYIFGYGFSTEGDLGILHRVEIGYAF